MPVHSGHSSQVVLVALEVVGLAVLPGHSTQTSPEFVPSMFSQPFAESLGVVLVAWDDGARFQDSQFVLQQVEECDGVAKQSLNSMWFLLVTCEFSTRQRTTLPADPPVAVLDLACVDYCIENEALDALSDRLVSYVLLDGEAFLGLNYALIELFVGAVVVAKEREHSVEHGFHFVILVGLVHSLFRLID